MLNAFGESIKQMSRILQITGNLGIGGMQTVAVNISKRLINSGNNVDFLVWDNNNKGAYEEVVQKMGARIIRISFSKSKLITFFRVKKAINQNGPYDVVHAHNFFSSYIFLCAAKKCNVPITIAHSHSVKRRSETLVRRLYYAYARRKLNKYANLLLACSKEAGSYVFGQSVFKSKGRILPNSIPINEYKFNLENRIEVRNELGVNDELLIGSVGRLEGVKNFAFLIKLIKELHKRGTRAKLLIAGDGSEKSNLQQLCFELGIEKDVFLLGNRNDISRLLSGLDIFIFPSKHEGLGIVLIEALSNGLCCLVEKNAIVEDIKKIKKCYSVEGYNISDWADQTISIVGSKMERELVSSEIEKYDTLAFDQAVDDVYSL